MTGSDAGRHETRQAGDPGPEVDAVDPPCDGSVANHTHARAGEAVGVAVLSAAAAVAAAASAAPAAVPVASATVVSARDAAAGAATTTAPLVALVAPLAEALDAATLVGCLGIAAVTPALVRFDVRQRRLPNPLVGVAAGAWAVSLVILVGRGDLSAASTSVLWATVALVIGAAAAVAGGLGMGDVKLGAVVTGLVAPGGPPALLLLWGVAGVLAVGVAGVTAIRSTARRRRPTVDRSPPSQGVPFGPCLLVAFWVVVVAPAVFRGLVEVQPVG